MSELPEPTCADCISFTPERRVDGVARGPCRFRPELGEVPEDLPHCPLFQVRRDRADKVKLPAPPKKPRGAPGSAGRARAPLPARDVPTLATPIRGDTTGEIRMDREGLKQVLRELLEAETLYGYPELGQRWEGGTLVIKPAEDDRQPKEIPLETFFHKIVMLRDRLRVLEAKLNGHDKLSEGDKVELQGYITKCYGTLTTFNVLFRSKEEGFRSR